jgi:hypothetical protein
MILGNPWVVVPSGLGTDQAGVKTSYGARIVQNGSLTPYTYLVGGRRHDGTFRRTLAGSVYSLNFADWPTYQLPFDVMNATVALDATDEPDRLYVGFGECDGPDGGVTTGQWGYISLSNPMGWNVAAAPSVWRCDNGFMQTPEGAKGKVHVFGGASRAKGDERQFSAGPTVINGPRLAWAGPFDVSAEVALPAPPSNVYGYDVVDVSPNSNGAAVGATVHYQNTDDMVPAGRYWLCVRSNPSVQVTENMQASALATALGAVPVNMFVVPVEDSHHVYDIATDTWVVGSPMPGPLVWCTAVTTSPARPSTVPIHVFGISEYPATFEMHERQRVRKWYVYYPDTDTWEDKSVWFPYTDDYTPDSHYDVVCDGKMWWLGSAQSSFYFIGGFTWDGTGKRATCPWTVRLGCRDINKYGSFNAVDREMIQGNWPGGALVGSAVAPILDNSSSSYFLLCVGGTQPSIYQMRTRGEVLSAEMLGSSDPSNTGAVYKGNVNKTNLAMEDFLTGPTFPGVAGWETQPRIVAHDSYTGAWVGVPGIPDAPLYGDTFCGWTMDPAAAGETAQVDNGVTYLIQMPLAKVPLMGMLGFGIVNPHGTTVVKMALFDRNMSRIDLSYASANQGSYGAAVGGGGDYLTIPITGPGTYGVSLGQSLYNRLGRVDAQFFDQFPYIYVAVQTEGPVGPGPTFLGAAESGQSLVALMHRTIYNQRSAATRSRKSNQTIENNPIVAQLFSDGFVPAIAMWKGQG